jgi:hypothetical protein
MAAHAVFLRRRGEEYAIAAATLLSFAFAARACPIHPFHKCDMVHLFAAQLK